MIALNLAELINRLMRQAADAQQAAAKQTEYSEVEAALVELTRAVEAARARDDAEAWDSWTEWARIWKHRVRFLAERDRFFEEAEALKETADSCLSNVRAVTSSEVGVHAGVPDGLIKDADNWRKQGLKVHALALRTRELEAPDGWIGTARENYAAAIEVQRNALSELEGIMESTANGCKQGAVLNRAVFFVVKQAILAAANRINGVEGGGGSVFYLRTARACEVCTQLAADIQDAADGGVVGGTASQLSSDIVGAVAAPNLLQEGGWPRGISGVGTAPAKTDTVPADGDPNLDPDGVTIGLCVKAVEL